MELLQLKYFIALAQKQHLTQTAKDLMISPPSLSATIKKLETELGVPLFDRSGKHITLNADGELFYKYVSDALNLIDTASFELRSKRQAASLTIGVTSQQLYSDYLYYYEQTHPHIHLSIIPMSIDQLSDPQTLSDCNFYLGIIEDIDLRLYDYRQIFPSEKPIVLISAQNPLSVRDSLTLSDLRSESFISVSHENSSAHQYMLRIFEEDDFVPRRLYQGSYLTRIKMISQNKAVSITTIVGAEVNAASLYTVKKVPLAHPVLTRTQSVCWNKHHKLSQTEQEFVSDIVSYFQEHPLIDPKFLTEDYFFM